MPPRTLVAQHSALSRNRQRSREWSNCISRGKPFPGCGTLIQAISGNENWASQWLEVFQWSSLCLKTGRQVDELTEPTADLKVRSKNENVPDP